MSGAARSQRSPLRFFGLLFGLTVPFYVLGALAGTLPPAGVSASALMFPVPLLAAVILVRQEEGPAGARRLLRSVISPRGLWRRPAWLAAAVFSMPAVAVLSYAVMRLLDRPLPEPQLQVAAIPGYLAVLFVLAACEEAGWSGYAIDPLRERQGAFKASVGLGAVWGLWHLVPYLQGAPYDARPTATWVLCQAFVFSVAARVVIVCIYDGAGGSVLAATVFHAMSNVSFVLFPNGGSHYDPLITGAIVALVALLMSARRWRPARAFAGRRRREGGRGGRPDSCRGARSRRRALRSPRDRA